jgi:hypothetical protein
MTAQHADTACGTSLLCEGFQATCSRPEGHSGHHFATVFGNNFEWLWYAQDAEQIDGKEC